MKERYQALQMEIIAFETEDVITTSGEVATGGGGGGSDKPVLR